MSINRRCIVAVDCVYRAGDPRPLTVLFPNDKVLDVWAPEPWGAEQSKVTVIIERDWVDPGNRGY